MQNGPLTDPSLEQRVGAQALAIDLKQAVLACLTGAESRRWTVGELFSRLRGLGVPGTRAGIARALSELYRLPKIISEKTEGFPGETHPFRPSFRKRLLAHAIVLLR